MNEIDLKEFECCINKMLNLIGEDTSRDGLIKTPNRVAKAFSELTSGYKEDPKKIINEALFKTTNKEMVLVKDINFFSLCEHHLLPIIGVAHIAYIPDEFVVGLSKIPRIVEIYAKRLQIQEQLSEQIADALNFYIKPKWVGVCIEARHMCMEMRGIKKIGSITKTLSFRGKENKKDEFLELIKA